MTKVGELDWGELYKTGQVELDPLSKKYSKPVKMDYHKTGEKPSEEELRKDVDFILSGWADSPEAQWRDEDHLEREVVTQEDADKMQKNWEEAISGFYEAANEPIIGDTAAEWNGREPLTKGMSEEELAKWRMYTGE